MSEVQDDAIHSVNLPEGFTSRMRLALGADYEAFIHQLSRSSPVSIRLHPQKPFTDDRSLKTVPWCSTGRYLPQRPVFTLDPHFHGGAYYVQEASSMFMEQAWRSSVEPEKELRVLDACAAPGGKSTHLLGLMNKKGLLVSNEVIRSRSAILSENIQKWGYTNVVVTQNDPVDFQRLPGFFDVIVVDAPCSGEGLFRKDEHAAAEWSESHVEMCAMRQRRILSDLWPSLKEDGVLIYCTCTYNETENESNLNWFARNNDVSFIELDSVFPGIEIVRNGEAVGYRFFPHMTEGEGFFLSIVKKKSPVRKERDGNKKKSWKKISGPAGWLHRDFTFIPQDDLIIAVPESQAEDMQWVCDNMHVITKGVAVATASHSKLIPSHSLALSLELNRENFSCVELSYEDAIHYLKKDTLDIDASERGFALVLFQGTPLGWINRIGTRINNLYPVNWRIRMST